MRNKPNFVTDRMPYDAENKTLSKAQFEAKMRAKKELEAKLKAYETELKGGAVETPKVEASVVNEPPKKAGRPKKVE